MDGLQETFRWAALECAAQAPVAAYAFGRQHNFGDLVVAAAQLSLETSIIDIPHSPELKRISGSELQELIGYHRRCQVEASELALTPLAWSTGLSQMPAASETRHVRLVNKGHTSLSKVGYLMQNLLPIHPPSYFGPHPGGTNSFKARRQHCRRVLSAARSGARE